MDAIDQMPDFGSPLALGDTLVFPPVIAGPLSVMPNALHLSKDAQGQPALSLQIVKRTDDLSTDGQYAVLDMQITGDYALDDALALARTKFPEATVKPASIEIGYARLVPAGADIKLPDDLTVPEPFGWACANGARWTRRLDRVSGELIKGALRQGTVLFSAQAEFTILGVAPRAPLQLTFAPAELLDAILAGANDREIDYAALLAILMRPLSSLPIKITAGADATRLPEILRDRLFAAYGSLVPAPAARDPLRIRFASPPSGTVAWDLSQPVVAPRAFSMQFDMLRGLREAGDPAKLIHETVIPALDVGFRSITVAANLPKNRVGVPAIGARIDVPANPPFRPSGVSETIAFNAPGDEGTFSFKLSPDEALRYSLTCFVIVAAGAAVSQYETAAKPSGAGWLRLQSTDFPVSFTHITASDRLLELAVINGALTYKHSGQLIEQPIMLSKDAADVAVVVPNDAGEAGLTFTAIALDGTRKLSISEVSPGRIELDLTSFPEYGPHRVPISCQFKNGSGALSVDLLGEDGANPATVTLVPSSPTATWGYVAQSPFRSGYRYREHAGAWSDVIPATTPLQLEAN